MLTQRWVLTQNRSSLWYILIGYTTLIPQTAADKLTVEPSDVEAFVRYLGHVEQVVAMVPGVERELLTLTNLHNVAQDFQITIGEEETALYKGLFPLFRHLKVSVEQHHRYTSSYGRLNHRSVSLSQTI